MTEQEDESAEHGLRVVRAVGRAATALATTAATLAGKHDLAAFSAVMVPEFANAAESVLKKRRRRRLELGAAGMAYAGEPPEAIVEAVREASEEDSETTLVEAARRMVEAVSDDAVPSIGLLYGFYALGKRRADAFFRGCMRLLAELDADELHELTTILETLRDHGTPPTYSDRWVIQAQQRGEQGLAIFNHARWRKIAERPAHWRRLFHLLRMHGLAEEPAPDPQFGDESPAQAYFLGLTMENAMKLLLLLKPQPRW